MYTMRRLLWVVVVLCLSTQVACDARSIVKEEVEEAVHNLRQGDYRGLQCPEPEVPAHSDVRGAGRVQPVGSVLYVICNEGYILNGPALMHCVAGESGAQWDPEVIRQCVEGSGNFDEELRLPWETEETEKTEETAEETDIKEELDELVVEMRETHLPQYLGEVYLSRANGQQRYAAPLEEGAVSAEERAAEQNSPLAEVLDLTPKYCLLPPETGPCRGYFPRYYFDKDSAECKTFIYGGCGGNKNNFLTKDDCDKSCEARRV